MFGAGQTKQRNSTNTKKTKRRKTKKPKQRGEGAYLLSAKSPGTGSSPGRGLHEKREVSSVERWGGTAGCSSGEMPGGTGRWGRRHRGRTWTLPRAFPSLPLQPPPTLTFRILRRQQARLHGALRSARRSPAPGARMARRRLREERVSARPRTEAVPALSPLPRPVEPPLTWGKVNGTCWSTYPFILPPGRYLRGRGAPGSRSAPGGGTEEGYQRAGTCRGRGLQAEHPPPDRGIEGWKNRDPRGAPSRS